MAPASRMTRTNREMECICCMYFAISSMPMTSGTFSSTTAADYMTCSYHYLVWFNLDLFELYGVSMISIAMYQQLRLELYAVHNTFQLQGTEGNHQTHPYYISLFSCEKALYCAKARDSMAYETISHNYFTSWGKLRLIPEIYIYIFPFLLIQYKIINSENSTNRSLLQSAPHLLVCI
ncbi:uncharacterized protein LOC114316738 isoform X2 [Camellia sinensis]|uniref:uncharacterized protein LOC114316738 isoform X2 n=1 Tax=Camellia sinensis TaxID=4442 RepID=UPI001035CBFA|nr:uncharacterized protein LOC114316738 isoform X2 [Camellia sinensis]